MMKGMQGTVQYDEGTVQCDEEYAGSMWCVYALLFPPVMLLGVNIVMSLVVVVVLAAIIIVLIVVARRYGGGMGLISCVHKSRSPLMMDWGRCPLGMECGIHISSVC